MSDNRHQEPQLPNNMSAEQRKDITFQFTAQAYSTDGGIIGSCQPTLMLSTILPADLSIEQLMNNGGAYTDAQGLAIALNLATKVRSWVSDKTFDKLLQKLPSQENSQISTILLASEQLPPQLVDCTTAKPAEFKVTCFDSQGQKVSTKLTTVPNLDINENPLLEFTNDDWQVAVNSIIQDLAASTPSTETISAIHISLASQGRDELLLMADMVKNNAWFNSTESMSSTETAVTNGSTDNDMLTPDRTIPVTPDLSTTDNAKEELASASSGKPDILE